MDPGFYSSVTGKLDLKQIRLDEARESLLTRGLGRQYRESLIEGLIAFSASLSAISDSVEQAKSTCSKEQIDVMNTRISLMQVEVERLLNAERTCVPSAEIVRRLSEDAQIQPMESETDAEATRKTVLETSASATLIPTMAPEDKVEEEVFESPESCLARILSQDEETIVDHDLDVLTASSLTSVSIYSWGRPDLCALFPQHLPSRRTIRQISSNTYHSAAVTTTGELYLTGCNDDGQIDTDRTLTMSTRPRVCESLFSHKIQQVSCGLTHTACLTSTGVVLSFGGNEVGELGHSPAVKFFCPPRTMEGLNNRTAIQVSCGERYTLVLTSTGEVFSCGAGASNGQRHGRNTSQLERIEALIGTEITAVSAGATHSLALSNSGSVYGWGSNVSDQLGIDLSSDGQTDMSLVQTPVSIPLSFSDDDSIGESSASVAVAVEEDRRIVVGISAGYSHSVCWTESGLLLGCGLNKQGQLASMLPRVDSMRPIPILGPDKSKSKTSSTTYYKVKSASCGINHTVVLCEEVQAGQNKSDSDSSSGGCMYVCLCFGSNNFGQCDPSSTSSMFRNPITVSHGLLSNRSLNGKERRALVPVTVSAGGDQSFAICCDISCDSDEENDSDISFAKGLLERQFSVRTGNDSAAIPSAKTVVKRLQSAVMNGERDLASSIVNNILTVLSLPSTLSNSFVQSTGSDIGDDSSGDGGLASKTKRLRPSSDSCLLENADCDGVEAVYCALLDGNLATLIGSFSIPQRLLSAILCNIEDLILIFTLHQSDAVDAGEVIGSPSLSTSLGVLAIRCLLILMQCPILGLNVSGGGSTNVNVNANATGLSLTDQILSKAASLLGSISGGRGMSSVQREMFCDALSLTPMHIFATRILAPFQSYLARLLPSQQIERTNRLILDSTFMDVCRTLGWIYLANLRRKSKGLGPLSLQDFSNPAISSISNHLLLMDYSDWRSTTSTNQSVEQERNRFISAFPFLVSMEKKKQLLVAESQSVQTSIQHRVAMVGGLPYFVLPVSRDQLLSTALHGIHAASDLQLKMPLKVHFVGEEGIDEGGVRKEFFQLLTEQLFDMKFGMFVPCGDRSGTGIWFNRDCTWSAEEFYLIGVLLGLAVYNGIIVNTNFPSVVYRKLLPHTQKDSLDLDDLSVIDPELATGLRQLLCYEPAEEVEHVFCREFSVEWTDAMGESRKVDLIPNGSDVAVTGQNRKDYVDAYVRWFLLDSVKPQFDEFARGFSRVVDRRSVISLFQHEELELLIAGYPHLDLRELQQSTEYIGWPGDVDPKLNPTVVNFWSVVIDEFTLEEKQRLLMFATGCRRAPLGGLRSLEFKIQRMGPDSSSLPTSHTCFNTLLLPEYSTKEKLRERLLKAIQECEGFGLK